MNNNQRPGGQPRPGNNGYPQGQNRPAGRNGYTQNNTPRNGVPGNNNQQNNIPRGNPQRNNPAQNGARGTYNNNQRQGNPNGRTANSRPANNRPGNAPRNYRAPAKRSAEPQKVKLTAEQIEKGDSRASSRAKPAAETAPRRTGGDDLARLEGILKNIGG